MHRTIFISLLFLFIQSYSASVFASVLTPSYKIKLPPTRTITLWHPNKPVLLVGVENQLYEYDFSGDKKLIFTGKGKIQFVSVDSKNKWMVVSQRIEAEDPSLNEGWIDVLLISNGKLVFTYKGDEMKSPLWGNIKTVFTPNGDFLWVQNGSHWHKFDTKTGKQINDKGLYIPFASLSQTRDGQKLAASGFGNFAVGEFSNSKNIEIKYEIGRLFSIPDNIYGVYGALFSKDEAEVLIAMDTQNYGYTPVAGGVGYIAAVNLKNPQQSRPAMKILSPRGLVFDENKELLFLLQGYKFLSVLNFNSFKSLQEWSLPGELNPDSTNHFQGLALVPGGKFIATIFNFRSETSEDVVYLFPMESFDFAFNKFKLDEDYKMIVSGIKNKDVSVIKKLVSSQNLLKSIANFKDEKGVTPLMAACGAGQVQLIDKLVSAGASVSAYSDDQSFTLHECASSKSPAALDKYKSILNPAEFLRQLKFQNKSKKFPIDFAIFNGDFPMVEKLIEYGATTSHLGSMTVGDSLKVKAINPSLYEWLESQINN